MLKKLLIIGAVLVIGIGLFLKFTIFSMPRNHGHVEVTLFLGDTEDQPLIVAFGGSEGGNVFASDQLKQERDKFLERGYAFLAVGYFGTKTSEFALAVGVVFFILEYATQSQNGPFVSNRNSMDLSDSYRPFTDLIETFYRPYTDPKFGKRHMKVP